MMKIIVILIGSVAGIVLLLLTSCTYLGNRIMFEKPLPIDQKLSNITNNLVVAKVVWPNAEPWSYQLVVGLPANQLTYSITNRPCPSFTGIVTVTGPDNIQLEQFYVSSTNVAQCNWLIRHQNLDGFILTWFLTNALHSCTPGTQYNIKLEFDKRAEEFESLWLSYLQSQKQKQ